MFLPLAVALLKLIDSWVLEALRSVNACTNSSLAVLQDWAVLGCIVHGKMCLGGLTELGLV